MSQINNILMSQINNLNEKQVNEFIKLIESKEDKIEFLQNEINQLTQRMNQLESNLIDQVQNSIQVEIKKNFVNNVVSSKVMKENDYDHNKIDVLFESIKNIDSQLSTISEQLRILSENNQNQKKVENEIIEFSYTDFLGRDSKNFYKQTIYIYLPLYEICKDILKGKSRLIY